MKFTDDRIYNSNIILFILVILLVVNKFLLLNAFGFKYTGSDDLVFWQAATDYKNGIFHEPYFYGHNYNFLLESLLAVPLLIIGLPHQIAMPVISTLVGLLPFLIFALVLFRKGYVIDSYLFLLIPLTMPIEYDILTSVTRGFVNGIFFCSFLIFPLINPHAKKSFIVLALSASFAYIANPNSLIFSFPVYIYCLLENYKKPTFYLITLLCWVPALVIQYFSKQFYVDHPEYVVNWQWVLRYDFQTMIEGFSHLDKFFRYLTPVFWNGNWMVIILIMIAGFIAYKKDWKKGISILLCALSIFFLLGVNKINDDIGSIFLSSIRMFLAVPLLLGLSLLWAKDVYENEQKSKLIILCIAASVFLVKISSYGPVIGKHTQRTNYGPVAIKKLDDLKKECSELHQLTSKYNVDLIVFLPDWNLNVPDMEFYNYGCPILEKNFSPSVLNVYEKRTWVFEEEKKAARRTVLLFNLHPEFIKGDTAGINYEIINNNPCMMILRNNTKSLMELSEIFNFQYKRNTY